MAIAYRNHPAQPQTELTGTDSPLSSQTRLALNEDGSVPTKQGKPNPSFHLLVRTSDYNPNVGLCRTAFSAMVLNYPPPTMVAHTKAHDKPVNHIPEIDQYLSSEDAKKRFKDNDLLLIVDEGDLWFQLPAELMLQRFQLMLQENNNRLWKSHGTVVIDDGNKKGHTRQLQRYHERIIFSADKSCGLSQNDTACAVVPDSDLPPDSYGSMTDQGQDITLNRPRWLNSAAAIGTLADMRLLYQKAAKIRNRNTSLTETQVFSQMLGDQEYARELERQVTSSWVTRLIESLGIRSRMDISNYQRKLKPRTRYDYSVGVDYESQLFGSLLYSGEDVEWMRYDDLEAVSTAQARHKVPRETRLTLPPDVADLESPFTPLRQKTADMVPDYNKTLDSLPPAWNVSWTNLPLATNVHSKSIPALLHMNNTNAESWSQMWYHPWARGLLRKYIRASHSPTAAASSSLGGADMWDSRGGKGGIWTSDQQWSGWSEVCKGFEAEIFDDGFGAWGEEGGDTKGPELNEFGVLVSTPNN